VYYYLTSSLKRRVIMELQDSFKDHPIYSKIVPFIQDKYAFPERPQFGIIVKIGSVSKVQLAGDNYIGTIESHLLLAAKKNGVHPIEWVREDSNAWHKSAQPSLPGSYRIRVTRAPEDHGSYGQFELHPKLFVSDELLLEFVSGAETEAYLSRTPIVNNLSVWENGHFLLTEGVDYTVDWPTGKISLLYQGIPGARLTADYFVDGQKTQHTFQWNTADFTTIPGAILAFGKRGKAGDEVAVVVYPDRVDAAKAYGGKFEANFDLEVIAMDPIQREEIADLVVMALWGEKKPALEYEGLNITDVSMSGESEDIYDEAGDQFYYSASISLTIQGDWEIHVPLALTINRVVAQLNQMDELPLQAVFTPIIVNRTADFERIK
jgi:hypothetical protein